MALAYPWLNGKEIGFYSHKELTDVKLFSIIPFMLKTSSLCVYGDNIRSGLPGFKADRALANDHIIQLEAHIKQAKRGLVGNEDEEDIADCCGWIMKIIVRAGLALVMEKERAYTRDLYPAYQVFSTFYPKKERDMEKTLNYAINPFKSTEDIVRFLERFGDWMIRKGELWLEEYNPDRARRLPITSKY
ncbi:hypothetical protein ABFG93_09705 [Pseudalkalibacillus hwajinpoensis]|uniref:hypothetical protein n=1 Tax=Guptibacillus hwajinpoensis TaxID=208199 RepID=UPI00325BED4F